VIEIQASIIIDAPAEEVGEYVSDLGKIAEWDPDTLKVEWHRPVSVGSVAVVMAKQVLFGKRVLNMEITKWEPGHKFGAMVKSGGTSVEGICTIEPWEGNRTKLSRSATVEVGGWLRLLSPIIARKARNERSKEVENIKRMVEGHGSLGATQP
jgi:carbon monoxide dehydrogenase subunit G